MINALFVLYGLVLGYNLCCLFLAIKAGTEDFKYNMSSKEKINAR